jgi:ATP-dependent DNA ligase
MPANQGGGALLHEIKHDGFRVIGRKDGERVKLYSRSRGIVVPNAWRQCYRTG